MQVMVQSVYNDMSGDPAINKGKIGKNHYMVIFL